MVFARLVRQQVLTAGGGQSSRQGCASVRSSPQFEPNGRSRLPSTRGEGGVLVRFEPDVAPAAGSTEAWCKRARKQPEAPAPGLSHSSHAYALVSQ